MSDWLNAGKSKEGVLALCKSIEDNLKYHKVRTINKRDETFNHPLVIQEDHNTPVFALRKGGYLWIEIPEKISRT